jgi:hypothetical protein
VTGVGGEASRCFWRSSRSLRGRSAWDSWLRIARGAITSSALAAGLTNGAGWVFVAYDIGLLVIYCLVAIGERMAARQATGAAI